MRQLALARPRVDPTSLTVGEWLARFADLYPGNASRATREKYLQEVKFFARAHERMSMIDVTPLVAQAWAMKRPREVRHLRLVWQKAVLAGVVPVNVWQVVEPPRYEREQRVPPTQAQLDAIVRRCHERANPDWPEWRKLETNAYLWTHFADMVLFAAYTGARLGGCVALKCTDVDLERGRVTLHEKGGKTRVAALLGPSQEAIARAAWRHPRRGRRSRVFLTAKGNAIDRFWVSARWRKVAGDYPHGFHGLRHFAATWMLERGASELDVAVQLGHTDSLGRPYPELVRRVYGHPDPEDALQRLEGAVGVKRMGVQT